MTATLEKSADRIAEKALAPRPLCLGPSTPLDKRLEEQLLLELTIRNFWKESPRPLGGDSYALSFYSDACLCELRLETNAGIGFSEVLLSEDGATFLDGTGRPIHEFSATHPLALHHKTQAADYLRFFCRGLAHKEDTFAAITTAEDVRWRDDAPEALAAEIAAALRPPRLIWCVSYWQADILLLTRADLFAARFKITLDGMVDMIDDKPLFLDLPVYSEQLSKGVRLLTTPKKRDHA